MKDVQALLFDVGGSVFDWQSAIVSVLPTVTGQDVAALDGPAFAVAWREQSLVEMYEIAEEKTPWRPFRSFIGSSLDVALDKHGISQLSIADRQLLLSAWNRMPAWPEVAVAIARLRERFLVAPHTILGLGPVARSSKAAGLTWDAIISCDALGSTKTNPESYTRALDVIGFDAGQVCYVAAHASDLKVVQELGMNTAYVSSRLPEYGEDPDGTDYTGEFDLLADDYDHLAKMIV